MQGPHQGLHFNDSDLFKAIEGASYSLTVNFVADLDQQLDTFINKIGAAQESDGYLYTLRTIHADGIPEDALPRAGLSRWSNLEFSHELYNVGHLYEAAVAHYQATGKRTLLEIAIRNANLVNTVFGPSAIHDVPGHEEIEIGLVKLFHATGESRYLELATFFLLQRGQLENRPEYVGVESASPSEPLYAEPWYRQDHASVVEQRSAVGHAVRAGYLYSGMADVALTEKPAAKDMSSITKSFRASLQAIWEDVVTTKLYLTGGIGAHHEGEIFGDPYELPNSTAYAETCAAIAHVMWNHRMFLLSGDSKYIDVLERTLYNGLLSGISLDGDRFFYPNPLESDGRYEFNRDGSATRNPWFYCSCCPTNLVRFLPAIPGYVYAHDNDQIYVNLFVAGEAIVKSADGMVRLTQRTRYPWDGDIFITVEPEVSSEIAIAIRIPGWARGQPVPSDLYHYSETGAAPEMTRCALTVNKTPYDRAIDRGATSGWAIIRRRWKQGDVIHLRLPMPVQRVISHEKVVANTDKVAVECGPIVFCAEGIDNSGTALDLTLADEDPLTTSFEPEFLGGVVVIRRAPAATRLPLTLIPYFAWSHRDVGEMAVWLDHKDRITRLPGEQ